MYSGIRPFCIRSRTPKDKSEPEFITSDGIPIRLHQPSTIQCALKFRWIPSAIIFLSNSDRNSDPVSCHICGSHVKIWSQSDGLPWKSRRRRNRMKIPTEFNRDSDGLLYEFELESIKIPMESVCNPNKWLQSEYIVIVVRICIGVCCNPSELHENNFIRYRWYSDWSHFLYSLGILTGTH